jgi:hypothetical protein
MKRTLVAASVALSLVVGALGGIRPAAAAPSLWVYRSLAVSGVYQPLVGDFGGDGADDVLWYGPGDVKDSLWLGRAGQRGSGAFRKIDLGIKGRFKPVVGDFAGDEHDDVFWYAPGSAADYLWISDGTGRFTSVSRPVSGTFTAHRLIDYHPGGKDDLFFSDKNAGRPDYLWRTAEDASGAVTSVRVDAPALTTPIVGDWNGDGYEDLFLYGPGDRPDQRWLLLPDGTRKATRANVSGTYSPVVVYDNPNDGILWWGPGARPEAFWHSDGSSFANVRVRTVDGTATHLAPWPIQAAVISGTDVVDALFVGTAEEAEFYRLADDAHEKTTEQQPVVGDFDDDGAYDVLWYGMGWSADELWYFNLAAASDGPVAKGLQVDPRRVGLRDGAAADAGGPGR